MGYSVVDGRGNIYINGADAHRVRYRRRRSLSNRRVFADGLGLDGICLDAEGAVWVSTAEFSIARVAEGGEVLHASNLARTGRRSR